MRATINFETNVDEIFSVMFSLIGLETERLHDAAYALDEADPTDIISMLDAAVKDAHLASVQLQQYRDMLIAFEKARFETQLPQPADGHLVENIAAVQNTVEKMQQFDSFLSQISPSEGTGDDSQEG